ncbi:MAG: rhomboid family intramembrane serine protease [Armatimonadetes bacterium]|nr:rhomboid family intramembrane serine protease [Armatimonadota bacterium]
MIPLRDSIPSRTTPYVSYSIIGVCVLVHLLQYASPTRLVEWALVPSHLVSLHAWLHFGPIHVIGSLVTSQFLHADILHLASNLLFLWVFGDNVEDRLGHGRFLVFYLLCGIAAGLAQSVLSWFPDVPMLGASGAIAGVLGAYFMLFRTAWIRSLLIVFVIPFLIEIPAIIFIGIWFILQSVNALYTLGPIPATGSLGVAFGAHAAGFIVGILLLKLLLPTERHPHVRVVRWDAQ